MDKEFDVKKLGALLVGELIKDQLNRGLHIMERALIGGMMVIPKEQQVKALREFCTRINEDMFEYVSTAVEKINPIMDKSLSGELTPLQAKEQIDKILAEV